MKVKEYEVILDAHFLRKIFMSDEKHPKEIPTLYKLTLGSFFCHGAKDNYTILFSPPIPARKTPCDIT